MLWLNYYLVQDSPICVCGYIWGLLLHIVSRSFDLDLWPQFTKICVDSISLYLVCGNIMGSQCHILFLGHCEFFKKSCKK